MARIKNISTVDLRFLISLIKEDFKRAIEDINIKNEKHLRKELANFLELTLPMNVKVEEEVKTNIGIVDILVDNKYILELKYADNKGILDAGIAEVIRYNELKMPILMIILDVAALNPETITEYCRYYKENNANVIIIKLIKQRENSNEITSFLKDNMSKKKYITVEEILKDYQGNRKSLYVALSRLEKRGWIERIEKGKYMIVPLGAEKGKYTLNEFVIGSMLVEPYAIAYWSALHFYSLTEQIPNTVFIQTTARKKKQDVKIFGIHYKIVRLKSSKFFGVRREWIEETRVNITDKEKTIMDCLDKPQYCGGIVEVAKALKNGDFDKDKLEIYASKIGNSGVIRRLGFLCEFLGIEISLPPIKTKNYLYLDPTMPKKGEKNAKWRLIINLDEKILGVLE